MFVASKVLSSPLEAMYGLLSFIMVKDLHATPWQITVLVSLMPIVALLSFYGNLFIKDRPHRLKSLVIGTKFVGLLPCFFFPFVNNVWFFIFGAALFMTSIRAAIPAWSEILKINLTYEWRGKIFSYGSSAHYIMNLGIPLIISPFIDSSPHIWKWLFFIFACANTFGLMIALFIRLKDYSPQNEEGHSYQLTCIKSILLGPWKNCWRLMKSRPDFKSFQIVFMLGGAGIMLWQPVLPVFFEQVLKLSYTQLTLARSLCKGIGFTLTSSYWASWLHRIPIHLFNFFVTLFAALFGLLVIASSYDVYWIYAAYLLYGTMQAGSELSWNLSGPIFAKEKDSTLFTGVNVGMVGLRGCIAPFLGGFLFLHTSASVVFLCGGLLCLTASIYSLMSWSSQRSESTCA